MKDIQAQDRKLFWREACAPSALVRVLLMVGILTLASLPLGWLTPPLIAGMVSCILVPLHLIASLGRSVEKRFKSQRIKLLWQTCEDRLRRLEVEVKQVRKSRIAELQELPKTIKTVAQQLYLTLRRADIVLQEVTRSETSHQKAFLPPHQVTHDPQAQHLYQLADKNIVEYQKHYRAVIGGVQRAEAQAAVFSTTLDMLRMKMLSHRLAERSPEQENLEFLQSITEAKMQLDAIDKALEELELTPFPKLMAVDPPPVTGLFSEDNLENRP
ncbi:MAG TPA: hypothetical protein PLO61_09430 [Fimbriimonadaceae bacterium]|nr:hypothetical protein [Fimbriimonadaceae bacterium]HRJ33851.1 hypothetical protein [Fimbriimonadaceae bacterium]